MGLGVRGYGPSFGRARNPQTPGKSEGFFRVFREPFFCKTISHFSLWIFRASGAVHFQESFQGAGARLPARPPDAPWRPRRDGASDGASHAAPPRGGLPGKHDSWNHCPKSPPGFTGDLVPGKSSSKFGSKFRAMAPRKRRFFRVFGKSGCLKGAKEGPLKIFGRTPENQRL